MLPVWLWAALVDYAGTILLRQLARKERGSGYDSGDRSTGIRRRDLVKRISYGADLPSIYFVAVHSAWKNSAGETLKWSASLRMWLLLRCRCPLRIRDARARLPSSRPSSA